jgi:pyruvate kinase
MILQKKTKIVATIGPRTESEEMLTKLADAGLNVMRLNLSHGDHNEHKSRIDNLRKVITKTGRPIAILLDLSGPKIRIGEFYKERITLKNGQTFTLTTKKIVGDEKKVFINYPKLPKEIKKGDDVLLDDGKKRLRVLRVSGNEIICKVIVGGETKGRRGVNLPNTELSISAITPKDKKDLAFGVSHNVDFVALSFVRHVNDVLNLRKLLKQHKSNAQIIAKIETPQAVRDIDAIIEAADGIMVARGDLAVEVPAQDVPLIQKMLIKKCNAVGKPVISATQMLESMIHSPVPTRAEVSDIANAILDGTDAIMLSEETTLGEFPLEAVEVMAKVAIRVESDYLHEQLLSERTNNGNHHKGEKTIVDSITTTAVQTADHLKVKYLVALSDTGFSARMLSRYRASMPIIVVTPNEETWRKLALSFACYPVLSKNFKTVDETLDIVRKFFLGDKTTGVKKGDPVVLVCGWPFGGNPDTNMVLVEKI